MRHQQLVTTKELFIDGLQAEREGLLSQVPDEFLDDELLAELEKDAAAEDAMEATAAKADKMAKKRAQVVGEILKTEEDFLADMLLCRQGGCTCAARPRPGRAKRVMSFAGTISLAGHA